VWKAEEREQAALDNAHSLWLRHVEIVMCQVVRVPPAFHVLSTSREEGPVVVYR
jgi:hypothetical protein